MTTYRMCAYIPTVVETPASITAYASRDDITAAVNALSHFRTDMHIYSSGMCQIELDIRVLSETLPATVYRDYEGFNYIDPYNVAEYLDEEAEYDGHIILSSKAFGFNGITGVGGTRNGTLYAWVVIEHDRERRILAHEFGHCMTVYLDVVKNAYHNFPTCGAEPAMHCAVAYGYPDYMHPDWLTDFFSGTIAGGTGINATGWNISTPTDDGKKRKAPLYIERPSPQGKTPPARISHTASE